MSRAAHGYDAAHAADAAEVRKVTRLPREERSGDSPNNISAAELVGQCGAEGGGSYPSGAAAQSTPSHGGSSVAVSSHNCPGGSKGSPGASSRGKTLKPEQVRERLAFVREHRALGYRWTQIAALIGMHPASLQQWFELTHAREIPTTTTVRKCLKCERAFDSEGPGNRMCSSCRSHSHILSPYAPDPGGHTGRRVMPMRGPRK